MKQCLVCGEVYEGGKTCPCPTPRPVAGTNLYWFNHDNGLHSLVRQTQAKETVLLILDNDEYKAMQAYFDTLRRMVEQTKG